MSVLYHFISNFILFFIVVLSREEVQENAPHQTLLDIHIGGLFENLNSSGARAFEAAVNYVNENGLLPGKRLVAEVHQVSSHDSFQAEKILCELTSLGVAGIFGPQSRRTSYHVQSLCDTMEVPHLTARWDPTQRRSSCLLNLYPHPSALSKAVTDIVKAWEWKGFTVLYDNFDALMKIQELVKLADDKGYLVAVRQLQFEPGAGYRSVLREIQYSEEKNIVLECSVEILYDVLIQAQQVGLMGKQFNYIITSLDFHTIDYSPFMWGGTNITTLRLVDPDDPYVKQILPLWKEDAGKADDNLPSTTDSNNYEYSHENIHSRDFHADQGYFGNREYVRRMDGNTKINADGKKYKTHDKEIEDHVTGSTTAVPPTQDPDINSTEFYRPSVEPALIHDSVLLFAKALQHFDTISVMPIQCGQSSSWNYGYSIINYMRLSELQGTTGLVKFDHEGFRTEINLDIMELTIGGLKKKGSWNKTLSMYQPEAVGPWTDDGEDLRNTTFIVLIALTHPYNMLKEDSNPLKGNDRYEGFGVELIHELSLMSGFNYTFKEHFDKSSGNPKTLPNGTRVWDGMIGEVLAGRADLAIADITITDERLRDADFTHPFMNLGISILHRKPTKAPPSLFSFLDPFSSEVWAYMMSAYVGVSLLLFVMGRISPYEWTNPYPCVQEPDALENQFSLNNSFWFTVGSLMQQGSDVAPIAGCTRMVASIWWFFTLIMVSSYTAQLASFLTVENIVQPFKNIEELANQNIIKYGAKYGGSTVNFFRDSKDPVHQKIYKFMLANPDCMMRNNDEGVKRVLSEPNYAFFMESTSIEYEVERKCDLAQVGGLLDNKGYGIVMKQNSTYRNVLSKDIVKLQEKGKLTVIKDKWWKEKRGGGACSSEGEGSEASELSLDNTGGVFVVLLGGCMFSVLVAFCEVLWDVYQRENKISFKHELMEEIKFIIRCRGNVKPIRNSSLTLDNSNVIQMKETRRCSIDSSISE